MGDGRWAVRFLEDYDRSRIEPVLFLPSRGKSASLRRFTRNFRRRLRDISLAIDSRWRVYTEIPLARAVGQVPTL
jgi:hypothetical protein